MTDPSTSPGLRAGTVSLPEVLFQSITYMAPGIGIAFAVGIGVPLAGTSLPLALAIALVACAVAALAIGQLASRMPSAGGLYVYARQALGPRAGFTVGWYYIAFAALLPPFFALQEGWFVDSFLRSRGYTHLPGIWVYVVVYLLILFMLSYFNVSFSVRTSMILGGAEILVFVLLGLVLVAHGPNSAAPFHPSSSPDGWSGIAQAATFAVLAFVGFEAAASFGEESRNPRRAVPLAIIASSIGVGIFYLFLSYAWDAGSGMNIVGYHAAHAGADWPSFAQRLWGSTGAWIIFLALLNSIIAAGAAAMNSCSRVLYSMGRAGQLPAALGRVHPSHRTPYVAVLISLAVSALVSALVGWKFGAANGYSVVGEAFTILAIITYMMMCAACLRYFAREGRGERRVVLHVIVPVLGLIAFAVPLYAQAFDLGKLFNGHAFRWNAVYPFDWAVGAAVAWIVTGLIAMAGRHRITAVGVAEEPIAEPVGEPTD